VVVAVIDTGLDYFHPDMARDSLWRNPTEEANGEDDDGNGYVDDLIGWDFIEGDNNPWDWNGHGTHVAGIIAADGNNGIGIAGANPNARIMPLRALNLVGRGRSTRIAEAVYYAVKHGARVINLSMAVDTLSKSELAAIDHAVASGVVVVAAAGNQGRDAKEFGPAAFANVITVAATRPDDTRAGFSNWGAPVDIAAPGYDILSLRARRTDTELYAGIVSYRVGSNFVGEEARYYRLSGTSFAAPFVSAVASMIVGMRPSLKPADVKRMLLHSARDIDVPGRDNNTGYGLLDARAALAAEPAVFVEAHITGVQVVRERGEVMVEVTGTADANDFDRAWIEVGAGENPSTWKKATDELTKPVRGGALGRIPASALQGASQWIIQLVAEHDDGSRRLAWFTLNLG